MDRTSERVAAESERGEVVLFRRERDGALELRVNGVFVMDTVHTGTERLLATATLAETGGGRVLIGGLGLGFTLAEVLADARVATVHVVELEPAVVEWNRQGLVPATETALHDPRVRVVVGDLVDVLGEVEQVDVILLDVDNGPGYLVHDTNAAVYRDGFLGACRDQLAPGGSLVVWSASASPELAAALRRVFGDHREIVLPVVLDTTETTFHLYLARR